MKVSEHCPISGEATETESSVMSRNELKTSAYSVSVISMIGRDDDIPSTSSVLLRFRLLDLAVSF